MLRDTSVHQTTFAPKLPQLSIHTKTQVEINSGVIGLNFGLWHDMLHSIWCMTPTISLSKLLRSSWYSTCR